MTAASYTTDLLTVDLCDTNSNWSELSGHTTGGADAQDTETYIQGTAAVSQSTGQTTGTTAGMEMDYGSDLSGSMGTDDCYFIWQYFSAPLAIDTFANGGMRFGLGGTSGTNKNYWKTMGSDFGTYPYGGWQNTAIDVGYYRDYTEGSPGTGHRYFGSNPNMTAKVTKGSPHVVDAIRYGRGELKIEHGTTPDSACTFSGMATENDKNTTGSYNRWGLFQEVRGTYLWKGLLSFGNATNACTFDDSNQVIVADQCPRTYFGFNKIEINNTSSDITWTNIQISYVENTNADTSTKTRGEFEVVDNATVSLNTCVFTDMDNFTFNDGTNPNTATGCTWRRCGIVDQGGATITNCTFDSAAGIQSFTADTTNASATLSSISNTDIGKLFVGMPISGTNIPAGTRISAINGVNTTDGTDSTLTMTNNATATGTGITVTSAPIALIVDDLSEVTGNTFISDGSGHAVDVGNITTTQQINWNNTLDDGAGSEWTGVTGEPITTGTTGNEAILCNVSASQTLTIAVATGASIPTVKNDGTGAVWVTSSVTITITVKDSSGSVISAAQVGVYLTSDGSSAVDTADTNGSGVFTDDYTGTTPAEVSVRIRKASTGTTKYQNYASVQNISSSGLTLDVTLVEDPNNAS